MRVAQALTPKLPMYRAEGRDLSLKVGGGTGGGEAVLEGVGRFREKRGWRESNALGGGRGRFQEPSKYMFMAVVADQQANSPLQREIWYTSFGVPTRRILEDLLHLAR